MASSQIVPRREGDFNGWTNHYSETLVASPGRFFLTEEEVAELTRRQQEWDTAYEAAIRASDEARAATEAKNLAREALDLIVRSTARRIMADDRISNMLRKEAGLPIPKSTRTPVPVPTTSPRGQIVQTNRLEHSVLVTDSDTPSKRAKPPGVIGCEAMLLIRDMPSFDPNEYALIGVWTRFPEVVRFSAEDAGKTAHYLFRWLNTKGERGPWSSAVSATIPAV